jgi:hypothetical protein
MSDKGARDRATGKFARLVVRTGRAGRAVSRRVQLDCYGDVGVLRIADVPVPEPGAGQLVVQVLAAGINPGEIANREGAMEQMSGGLSRKGTLEPSA